MTEPTKKTYYYDNGQIECKSYWLNNNRHRTDGPALISYYKNGKINRKEYYLNGKKVTKKRIQEIMFNQQFIKDLEEELS